MPKQWLTLFEAERLAVAVTGDVPESIRDRTVEGGLAGEIAWRLRGPEGQIKAMPPHCWRWPINWDRGELSVQRPVRPGDERIVRDLMDGALAPKDLLARVKSDLLLEQMTYGAVEVTHWHWARIEVERDSLVRYLTPAPLIKAATGQEDNAPAVVVEPPPCAKTISARPWIDEMIAQARTSGEKLPGGTTAWKIYRNAGGSWPRESFLELYNTRVSASGLERRRAGALSKKRLE